MPNEQPILTIAIPTFNRAGHLSTLLSSLSGQLANESRVELLISDNASTDETKSVVRGFQEQGLPGRYIRNETNIGVDRNILQCYELATGKYLWIFGDDDVLEPTGLGRILSYIAGDEVYDLIYLKSEMFSGKYTPNPTALVGNITIFEHAECLARQVGTLFTFISGNIINKARVASIQHRPFTELLDTNLVQLGWIYTALEHHQRSLIVHDKLIAARVDNQGGYGVFKVLGSNLKRITEEWITSPSVSRPIINEALLALYPYHLLSSKKGPTPYFQEIPDSILRPTFRDNFRYWLFNMPIACLPAPFDWSWAMLVRIINKIDKMTGRYLVR